MKTQDSKNEHKIDRLFEKLKKEDDKHIPSYELFRQQLAQQHKAIPTKTTQRRLPKKLVIFGASIAAGLLIFFGLKTQINQSETSPFNTQENTPLSAWQSPTKELLTLNTQKSSKQLFNNTQNTEIQKVKEKPIDSSDKLFGEGFERWKSPTDNFLK